LTGSVGGNDTGRAAVIVRHYFITANVCSTSVSCARARWLRAVRFLALTVSGTRAEPNVRGW